MIPWCERPEFRENYATLRRKLIAEGKLEPDPLPVPPMAAVQAVMREWKENWCERPEFRENYATLRRKLIAEGKLEPDPLPVPPMAAVQVVMREWKEDRRWVHRRWLEYPVTDGAK